MSNAPFHALPPERDAAAGESRGHWLAYALAAAGAVAIFLVAFFATSALTRDFGAAGRERRARAARCLNQ